VYILRFELLILFYFKLFGSPIQQANIIIFFLNLLSQQKRTHVFKADIHLSHIFYGSVSFDRRARSSKTIVQFIAFGIFARVADPNKHSYMPGEEKEGLTAIL
jgi:hypothetical protein